MDFDGVVDEASDFSHDPTPVPVVDTDGNSPAPAGGNQPPGPQGPSTPSPATPAGSNNLPGKSYSQARLDALEATYSNNPRYMIGTLNPGVSDGSTWSGNSYVQGPDTALARFWGGFYTNAGYRTQIVIVP